MTFGDAGVNIVSAAVGRRDEAPDAAPGQAVMIVTTDKTVPAAVLEELTGPDDGLDAARAVSL
jgi:D-3-phosphoglycerate dehydrogenase